MAIGIISIRGKWRKSTFTYEFTPPPPSNHEIDFIIHASKSTKLRHKENMEQKPTKSDTLRKFMIPCNICFYGVFSHINIFLSTWSTWMNYYKTRTAKLVNLIYIFKGILQFIYWANLQVIFVKSLISRISLFKPQPKGLRRDGGG